jgi:prepilin-type N-terminal cleavage/methylation domain-containing protein
MKRLFSSGYSLIELTVVLLLIGLISGAIVRPAVTGIIESSALNTALRQVDLDLKIARNLALQSNLMAKVVFTNNTASYVIYEQHPTQNAWIENKTISLSSEGVVIKSATLANDQVVFDVSGTPYEDPISDLPASSMDAALSVTRDITIEYVSGGQRKVYIVPDTGYITINPN